MKKKKKKKKKKKYDVIIGGLFLRGPVLYFKPTSD